MQVKNLTDEQKRQIEGLTEASELDVKDYWTNFHRAIFFIFEGSMRANLEGKKGVVWGNGPPLCPRRLVCARCATKIGQHSPDCSFDLLDLPASLKQKYFDAAGSNSKKLLY